ncbi:hypothetical protein AB0I35_14575 [Nocardia sp. NPDC050378]|uniref:hypothetical protein n=1 Tax=Nocardia sp. NPDC050378 TaxID=3155400 RepID=UPI0033F68F26
MKGTEGNSGSSEREAAKVVRLPRRPRHSPQDVNDPRRRPWYSPPVYDPAPTRPVTRAELQAETGTWSADVEPQHPSDGSPAHEADVIDLAASRRKRGGDSPRGIRPKMMPRRVGSGERKQTVADTSPLPRTDR